MVNTVYMPNRSFRHFSKFNFTLFARKNMIILREAKLSWILFAVYCLSSSISFYFLHWHFKPMSWTMSTLKIVFPESQRRIESEVRNKNSQTALWYLGGSEKQVGNLECWAKCQTKCKAQEYVSNLTLLQMSEIYLLPGMDNKSLSKADTH